ncbi:MAG: permease [Tissierellia bacterium]|nr:permease [Tissierellia bacterium]
MVLAVSPEKALSSVNNSIYYLIEMIQVLPVIFLLTVVIDALVPKEMIMRGFGENSGIKGNLLALLLGSISAGPIYAAFPISKTLLGKGANISNIVIILSTWAVVKVPMLFNEVKFLGINFMIVRWILTVAAIFAMAYLTAMFVKKTDLPADESVNKMLEIKEEYCIGCGICVNMLPDYYEMENNKAVVRKNPEGIHVLKAINESINKCPAKAIVLNK